MRYRRALTASSLAGAVWLGAIDPAAAACEAPEIAISPATVEPGGSITITGTSFIAECNDVAYPPDTIPPTAPATDIGIEFVQGDRSLVLTTVDADSSYSFVTTVVLPADASEGPATVKAVHAFSSAQATVTVAASAGGELPITGIEDRVAAVGTALLVVGAWVLRGSRLRAHP